MRLAVIGAGIVGVTTAYELAAQAHEVTVFERHNSVAAEGSFGGSDLLAPALSGPWAQPGLASKVIRQLFDRDAELRFSAAGAIARLPWLWRWWRASQPELHGPRLAAMVRLAQFSDARRLELTQTLRLDYQQSPGCIVLLRGEREMAGARQVAAQWPALGIAHAWLDAAECHRLEPALAETTGLRAAIHLPQDGAGNCRQFAHLIKAEAQKLGARFRFETAVRSIRPELPATLETAGGATQSFDGVVVCAGVESAPLLHAVGLRLPLLAVHTHSITAPVRHLDAAPRPGLQAALVDARFRVAITRLGQRIRVAGIAQIGGRADRPSTAALRTLYRVLDDWLPGAARTQDAQHWKGTHPMLPEGPPLLGPSGAPGVWLNLGHGGSGWALACGSAQVLAEIVSGREAPLDPTHLTQLMPGRATRLG